MILTNKQINQKFIDETVIPNDCNCDRRMVCTLLGECFKQMEIVKKLDGKYLQKIENATNIGSALAVLKLTKHPANDIARRYKAAKKARKLPSLKKIEKLRKELGFPPNPSTLELENKYFKLTDHQFSEWYKKQPQGDFHY